MENRMNWNGWIQEPYKKKERRAFSPKEFFGDALRVATGELFIPERGFRRDDYLPRRSELEPVPDPIPFFTVAAERAKTFDLFLKLLEPLGDELSVVLKSTHDSLVSERSQDYHTEISDTVALESYLRTYEDLMIDDGCTSVSVMDDMQRREVTLSDHKLLLCYGTPDIMGRFQNILHREDVFHRPNMKVISDQGIQHSHRTTAEYTRQFQELTQAIGAEQH